MPNQIEIGFNQWGTIMKIFEQMKFRQKRIFSGGPQGGSLILLGLLLVAAIISVVPTPALAQAETGQIVGKITDPNGAVITGAKVKIVNVGTGAERNATSDAQGSFVATNLLPALYEVSVEASGFAVNKTRVQVTVGSKVSADFQLVVGGAQQVVEVVAGAGVQVNTETQTVAEVIDGKKITEFPSLTRNPYDFVSTAGNVSAGDGSLAMRGAGVSINGQRSAGTNILLDGAANNDEFTAGVGQTVPLDSVQEYSIITNNFTAEFGRASGGIVNVATKSGTNNYHGTAYEFGRYSRLNTNSFQNNANGLPKSVYTRNQFGYSVGGPVIKEKLFFFQSTEFLRVRSSDTTIVVVPTPQVIGLADPATQNFFNTYGKLKAGVTPLATFTRQSFIDAGVADPCASSPTCAARTSLTTPLFNRLAYTVPSDSGGGNPQNTYNVVGRVDWNINSTNQLYGRYALDRSDQFVGTVSNSPYQGFDTGQKTTNNSFVLSLTHTFSPSLILQSKVVYNRLNTLQPQGAASPTLFWRDGATTRFLGTLAALPGYLPFSPGSGIPFGGPQNFIQTYQDVNLTKGQHSFRFGGSYVYIQDNRTFGAYQDPSAGLGTTTVNFDNFFLGRLARFQGAVDPQGKFPCANPAAPDPSCILTLPVGQPNFSRSNIYHEFAFYGQDSWRVRPRLTLNLGLRYEYFGVQHNKNAALDANYYDANASDPFSAIRNGNVAVGKGLWNKDMNNFAPRVGFAWDVFGDGRTSLRGGYGIGYERNFGNVTFNVIQNPPNYAVIAILPADVGGTIPLTTSVAGPLAGNSGTKALPPVSLRNVNSNIRTAYAHFYSVTVERELSRGLVVALDYSGSNGRKLYSIEDPNRLGYGNVFLGDPYNPAVNNGLGTRLRTSQYTAINRRGGNGFSNYNAFNARVNINNFANSGLRLTTNYTYAHAQDNLSSTFSESSNNFNLGLLDPFNPGLDYGNSDFDLRQRFVFSGVWEVPFAKETKGFRKQILDGWELAPIFTAQTGTPFTIFDCTNGITACPRIFQTGALPRTGSSNPKQDPSTPGTFTYLDITGLTDSSFVNPITGTTEVGPYPSNMIGRNFFRGPGRYFTDMGIYKNFQVTERFKLQYRAEFYSLFNHANSSILGSEADASSQTVIRTQKDGRRNIQMALKLTF
jgi:outer membrane receptor protein involved in Fe transport